MLAAAFINIPLFSSLMIPIVQYGSLVPVTKCRTISLLHAHTHAHAHTHVHRDIHTQAHTQTHSNIRYISLQKVGLGQINNYSDFIFYYLL